MSEFQLMDFFVQFLVGFGEGLFEACDGALGVVEAHGLFPEEIEKSPGFVIEIARRIGRGSGGLLPSFQKVVEAHGADGIDKAHVDAALDCSSFARGFGGHGDGFVNGNVTYGAGREDGLGADDVEGAGVIEAVEGVDVGNAGDAGEDTAFFFGGEKRNVGGFRIGGLPFDRLRVRDTIVPEAALGCVECLDHRDKIRGRLWAGNFGEGFLSEGL